MEEEEDGIPFGVHRPVKMEDMDTGIPFGLSSNMDMDMEASVSAGGLPSPFSEVAVSPFLSFRHSPPLSPFMPFEFFSSEFVF